MAGKIIGSIEHFAPPSATSASVHTAFVAAFNLLYLYGPQVGIQCVAYNTGSQSTGAKLIRGLPGYYTTTGTVGESAFGVFRFTSASYPWELLITWNGAAGPSFTNFQGSAGNAYNFAIAASARTDRSSSWNGTSGSNGNDNTGSPLWVSGTLGGWIFPRSNDPIRGGAFGTNKNNTGGYDSNTNVSARLNFFADQDSFAYIIDDNNDGTYSHAYVGVYTPLSGAGLNVQIPLVAMTTNAIPYSVGTIYGDVAGTSALQGGIAWPTPNVSGSCTVTLDRYSTTFFQNTLAQPNGVYPSASYNEFQPLIGAFETQPVRGPMGIIDSPLFREVYNITTADTNGNGTRAAFGNATQASVHVTVPWQSGTVPGSGVTLQGVQFTIP